MSGELVPSQFRYTTTNNRDFVIGDPTDSNLDQPKYLVFQMTNQPGYNNNPHIKAEKVSGNWKLSLSQNGSSTLNFAYIDSANTFTASNTFQNTATFNGSIVAGVAGFSDITASGNVTVGGNLVVNGSTTSLNVANVTVNDKNIILNKGGLTGTGNGSGISIEENGSSTGYLQVSSGRDGWDIKAPSLSGIATIKTNGTFTYTLPAATGTLALTTDIPASPDLSPYMTLGTNQNVTSTKTLSVGTGALFFGAAGVNGSINGAGDGVFNTLNVHSLFTVNASGVVAGASFSGNHLGSVNGLTLPTPGTGSDNQILAKSGSTLAWTNVPVGNTQYVYLNDVITAVQYKLYMSNGVLTVALA